VKTLGKEGNMNSKARYIIKFINEIIKEVIDMWKNDNWFIALVIFFIISVIGALWALMIFL